MSYLSGTFQDEVARIVKTLRPKKFAAILHDKDKTKDGELVASHMHIVLQFKNARSLNNLSKLINQEPQTMEKWDGDVRNAYSYLLHRNSSSSYKHQYDVKEVISNFDYVELMQQIEESIEKNSKVKDHIVIKNYLDLLYQGVLTVKDINEQLTGSQLAKADQKIKIVHLKYLEKQADQWRTEKIKSGDPVVIIWIFGEAGTGKTELAKRYANNYSDSYYITGSSRDPFQLYNSENVIILDELRPEIFEYADLLKLLDPYNKSSLAPSRYFDKPILADVIIITSPYSPEKFYTVLIEKKKINNNIDSIDQLARRIMLCQYISKEHTSVYTFNHGDKKYHEEPGTREKNPISFPDMREEVKQLNAKKLYQYLMTEIINEEVDNDE